jgi:hypothetical protein
MPFVAALLAAGADANAHSEQYALTPLYLAPLLAALKQQQRLRIDLRSQRRMGCDICAHAGNSSESRSRLFHIGMPFEAAAGP